MDIKKHIEKRFLFEKKLSTDELTTFQEKYDAFKLEDIPLLKKVPKDKKGYLITETNELLQAFPFKNEQGNIVFIPEPDPILIYFHTAYMNYRLIADKRKEILKILGNGKMTEPIITQLYDYFGFTSSFVILLFTAMEAFINRAIPYNFIYEKPDTRRTELYNKEQIEKYLPFNEKRNEILLRVTGKNFAKGHPTISRHIDNLKEFRDAIVHTKASNDGHTPYDYLYKRALNFDYKKALDSVGEFMNFYHEKGEYIKECPCTKNW